MELPELHVFQRNAGASGHAEAVAGIDERVGRRREDPPGAAGGQHRRLRLQDHRLAGFHFIGDDADDVAVGVAYEVERHPFDEELRARAHVALVERVQHRVAGSVRRRARALHGRFTEVGHVSAERTLVDGAVGIAVERHAEVLELVDDLRRHLAHVFDRVLVAQPVGPLDRVVHVPVPVVGGHVAERRADAALRRHRVRARREHLGQHGDAQAGLGQLQRRAHSRAAGADNDRVEFLDRHHEK